jgi:hypothetical protein
MRGNLGDARTRETSYRPTTHILIPLDWKIFELEGEAMVFVKEPVMFRIVTTRTRMPKPKKLSIQIKIECSPDAPFEAIASPKAGTHWAKK